MCNNGLCIKQYVLVETVKSFDNVFMWSQEEGGRVVSEWNMLRGVLMFWPP